MRREHDAVVQEFGTVLQAFFAGKHQLEGSMSVVQGFPVGRKSIIARGRRYIG